MRPVDEKDEPPGQEEQKRLFSTSEFGLGRRKEGRECSTHPKKL